MNIYVGNLSYQITEEDLKEVFGESCAAIVNDVVQIAKADGKYDDVEKEWASNIASDLGVEDPNA